MQIFKPCANIKEAFCIFGKCFLLLFGILDFRVQFSQFFIAQQTHIANFNFNILDRTICTRIQIMNGNSNLSVNSIAREFFENCSAFILIAL